jgi:hypothetical protein
MVLAYVITPTGTVVQDQLIRLRRRGCKLQSLSSLTVVGGLMEGSRGRAILRVTRVDDGTTGVCRRRAYLKTPIPG